MKWLINLDTATDLRHATRTGRLNCSATERETFATKSAARGGPLENGTMSVSGDVAQLNVSGLLTKQTSLMAWLLGYQNTSYGDIQSALALADNDPAIKRVTLAIDSPGGSVAGLFETLGALNAFSKPIVAVASLACSAAYSIASTASKIRAVTAASEFGSIGVACEIFVDDSVVSIASSNAPNKRPDVTTPEGQGVVRAELDALYDLFVDAIARGRKTTAAKVNSDFGRGGSVVAVDARRRGMIDSIATPGGKKAAATANPYTDLGAYLTQRMGGPMFGEGDLDFAERLSPLLVKAREMRQRNASIEEFIAYFGTVDEDNEHDEAAALLAASSVHRYGQRDLGDQVADILEARRGKVTTRLQTPAVTHDGPKDLGDLVVERMIAARNGA